MLPAEGPWGWSNSDSSYPSLFQASMGLSSDPAPAESHRGRCKYGHVMQFWPMRQKDRSPGDSEVSSLLN